MKTIRRPISILLAILMVVGMFTMVPISAGAAVTNYYIIGDFNNWDPNDTTYELKANTSTQGEYMYTGFTVDANTGIKVIDNERNYYPAGTNNDFKLNDAGSYDIYFNPNGRSDGDWENGIYAEIHYVAKIGDAKYKTLEEAFAAAVDGQTITVLADSAGNGIKVTPAGKFTNGLTVDFNGHTYTVDGETVGSPGTQTLAFQLLKNNKVTFQNGTLYSEKAKMLVQNYCDLTLDNMTLTLNNTSYNGAYTLSNNNGSTVIKDTTINANPTTGSFAFDVCRGGGSNSYPSVDVTVTGNSVINGNVEVYAKNSDPKDGLSLTLESGTMNGNIVLDQTAENVIAANPDKITIAKDEDFTQAAPEGYKWDDSGVLVPVEYVAQIGDTKYETLADAIAAAQTDDTITLLEDIALTGANWFVVDNKDVTIDLGGKNISSEDSVFVLKNGADLTVKNGTMTTSVSNDYAIYVNNGSIFTLDNDATLKATASRGNGIIVRDGGEAVINGTIESGYYSIAGFGSAVVDVNAGASITSTDASALSGNGSDGNEGYTFNINGGTLTSVNDVAIYHPNQGTLNITGGTITGATAIYVKSGTTDISTSTTSISGATITGNGAAKELVHSGNGCNPTGDAIVIENCGYPGGAPAIDISGGTIVSVNADPVHSYGYNDYEPIEKFVSGGTFNKAVPAEYCAEGYDPVDDGDGTYTVAPHEHDWDYENVTWNFTESASHIIYAKYTLTCKTDPTHTKEQTGSGTMMLTVAVDGDKFVYSHSAVKIDGNSVAVPNYTRNIADGIINQYELKAAVKVAGNYKLANDITGFTDNVNPVDGFVLDGQNHMIKYGTINASNRVMFVAADQNTKFTLKNITLDGNNKAKWAVCAYTGNSGNNAGNVITLDTVTIQNFKSNDYVGAINAFGSSTWNLKDCTITGNTTVDDSDGLSGSAVWAGSKATINIDGGTYDEVYLHSYSGTGAVLNADGGATIDNLVLDLTKTDTLKANIDEATVGAITANDGFIPEEAVVMDPDKATVAAPEGYEWIDSEETGMKTLGHVHSYDDWAFNWTQDAATGDWNCNKLTLTCSCGDTQEYDVTGFFGASAVTCTANDDGSFTYTVTKKVGDRTYTDTQKLEANNVIKSVTQLKAAAKKGGEWELGNDLDAVTDVQCANGFVLDGNNHTVTRHANVSTQAVFRTTTNPAEITLKNLTIDGIANQSDLKPAIATKQSNPSAGNVINLENVDIINYNFDADNNGTVLAWGEATVNMTNCTVDTDSNYDVWAGAAAKVNINDGEYGNVYLNSGSNGGAALTVDDDADVANITLGGAKATATIEDGNVDKITANFDIPKEAVVMDPVNASVAAPAGYKWVDSATDGMKTLTKAKLFAGYGLTLHGDIGLIFYLDPAAVGLTADQVNSVSVDFTCDQYSGTYTASGNKIEKDDNGIKVKYYVPAAYMASDITAYNVKFNGVNVVCADNTDTYSVQEYAQRIMANPVECGIPAAKADAAITLMKEMLNYGAKAKAVFETQMESPEEAVYDPIPNYTMANVTANDVAEKIKGTATDMSGIHPEPDANFYSPSVIYLSKTTLRMVFLIPTGNGSTCPDEYAGNQGVWYYWAEVTDIPAAELDEQQQFEVNGVRFNYSALDYVKAVLNSNMDGANKALAASLFLYNQAANAYYTV